MAKQGIWKRLKRGPDNNRTEKLEMTKNRDWKWPSKHWKWQNRDAENKGTETLKMPQHADTLETAEQTIVGAIRCTFLQGV